MAVQKVVTTAVNNKLPSYYSVLGFNGGIFFDLDASYITRLAYPKDRRSIQYLSTLYKQRRDVENIWIGLDSRFIWYIIAPSQYFQFDIY